MSNYAHIVDNEIINIVVCEDANIGLLSGNYIKITDARGTANIGGSYIQEKDKFIKAQPYQSWTLNENDEWVSPTGQGDTAGQIWNEEDQEWIILIPGPEPE
jgi:hypothetical protein